MNISDHLSVLDTGIDWLGTIPKHWKVRRLKFISNVQSSSVDKKSKDDEDEVLLCNYVDVYKNEFIDDSIEFMKATAPQRHIEQFTLNQGDIIITKDSEDRFDIAVPAKVENDFENVLCGYHLALIRPDSEQINSGFLFRWFQSDLVNDQFKVSANGITRYGLSVSSIKDSVVAVPPLPEQKAIASFLDHQTTRIDQLIEKKKRLLDLLDEQRQAIITNAVTKGINPDAPMKDSGIDWLGEVPEHWEVTRLKYFLSEPLKYGANEAAELEDHDSPRYIRITDIKDDGTLKNETYKSLEFEVAKPYLLKDGDVLLARSGATVGKTFQYRSEWGISAYAGYLIRARFVNQKTADWFYYFSKSKAYWDWLKSTFIQATIQNVSAEKYSNLFFSVPPQEEIDQILSYLDQQTSRIDQLKTKIQTAIDRLEEYRSSLITQAVTGKIDVRDTVQEVEMSYAAEEGELYKTNK